MPPSCVLSVLDQSVVMRHVTVSKRPYFYYGVENGCGGEDRGERWKKRVKTGHCYPDDPGRGWQLGLTVGSAEAGGNGQIQEAFSHYS